MDWTFDVILSLGLACIATLAYLAGKWSTEPSAEDFYTGKSTSSLPALMGLGGFACGMFLVGLMGPGWWVAGAGFVAGIGLTLFVILIINLRG